LSPQFRTRDAAGPVRDHLAVGLSLFLLGLFKKVVLTDSVAAFASPVFEGAARDAAITFFEAWGGVFDPVTIPARLPVRPAWRQPARPHAALVQPAADDDTGRTLAPRRLELRFLAPCVTFTGLHVSTFSLRGVAWLSIRAAGSGWRTK
jgi:hypothetical protein